MSHIPVDDREVEVRKRQLREQMRAEMQRELEKLRDERWEEIELRVRFQVEVLERYSQDELKVLMKMIEDKFYGED